MRWRMKDPPDLAMRCRFASYLSGRHHIGRQGVEEIVETVFEVPTSLGSVSALEGETSADLMKSWS